MPGELNQSQTQRAEGHSPGDKPTQIGKHQIISRFQHLRNLRDFPACRCPFGAFWIILGRIFQEHIWKYVGV